MTDMKEFSLADVTPLAPLAGKGGVFERAQEAAATQAEPKAPIHSPEGPSNG